MYARPQHGWTRTTILAALVAAWVAAQASAAPEKPAVRLETAEQTAFQAAAHQVAPSVVRIETVGGLEQVGELHFGAGPTTGLIVSEDGYLVSSAFNFANRPDSILVELPDGVRKPAQLVATDHNRLLVLLKIEPDHPLPVPEVAPESEVRVGQWAVAVGRTFDPRQPNVSVGIVSALRRIWGKALQTDAAVSPDNYGGPLVDLHGRVLGLLMPLSPESDNEMAGYEWYNSGIGFAVPLSDILAILPRLKEGHDLHRGLLGITFDRERTDFEPAVIAAVHPNGPAAKGGLHAEDHIVAVGAQPVARLADFKRELTHHYAGDRVALSVEHDGQTRQVDLELAAELEPYQTPFLGILPLRRPVEPEAKPAGIAVRYVYADSPAAGAGIVAGDLLVSCDGQAVPEAETLRRLLAQKTVGDRIALEVRHGDETRNVSIVLAGLPESFPADPLPAAWASQEPSKPEGPEHPQVGLRPLQVPDLPNQASLYVPETYQASRPCGLVVWLHGPGGVDEKQLLDHWKAVCERDRVLLLVPKATDGQRWQLPEMVLVGKLLSLVNHEYTLDPTRIVVGGAATGGTLAYLAAFQQSERVRGVVAIDASLAGRVPPSEPLRRIAFFLAQTPAGADATGTAAKQLRAEKYPVTLKELEAGASEAALVPDLAQWLDSLDRI